jgi:hypothetical protein
MEPDLEPLINQGPHPGKGLAASSYGKLTALGLDLFMFENGVPSWIPSPADDVEGPVGRIGNHGSRAKYINGSSFF